MSHAKTPNQVYQISPFAAVATVPGDFLAPALSEAINGSVRLFRAVMSIIRR